MELNLKGTSEYKEISFDEAMKILETTQYGLSAEDAENRIKEFGYNEIAEIKRNPLLEFFKRY